MSVLVLVDNIAWANRVLAMTLLVVTLVACDRAPAPPKALVWDLSLDNEVSRVDWPAKITDDLWYVDGPGTIRLKIRGGLEGEIRYWFAQVKREGGRIRTVRIMMPPGDTKQVYADATKLADDWQFADRQGIKYFSENGDKLVGVSHYPAGSILSDAAQPRMIEIRAGHASVDKHWHTLLAMGFVTDFGPDDTGTPATTQAVSKPATTQHHLQAR